MEPPAPGVSIDCVPIHGRKLDRGDTTVVVTGTAATVVLEWSRTPAVGLRRMHLRDEIQRDSPRLWDALQRMVPVSGG